MTQSRPPEDPSADWSLLPWVLGLAFGLRLVFALTTDTILQPDEMYQYLEQAHRLVFGQGFIPWEFQHGARSWLIAGAIAPILKLCAMVGLGRPDVYQPVVKIVLCAVATSLPLSLYRICQARLGEAEARVALVGSAIWYELINMSARPFPDALGTYALYGALALLIAPRQRWADVGVGVLCGLTFALRFQFAPAVGLILLIGLIWRRRAAGPMLLAFAAVVIVLAGALDAVTLGEWFGSTIQNARYNVIDGMAKTFGVAPPYDYLITLAVASGGLAVLGALGLLTSPRRTWPVSLPLLAQFAAFSAISHKEPRFILFMAPLWLLGLAALTRGRWLATTVTVIAAISLAGLLRFLPFEGRVYPHPLWARSDVRQAYLVLSRRSDVSGLIDASGVDWGMTGGYYDLNQDAPIYRPDIGNTQFHRAMRAPALYASYWLGRTKARPPAGFGEPQAIGGLTLWRRLRDQPGTIEPPGYSTLLKDFAVTRRPPRGAAPSL